MALALEEAKKGFEADEVPVGALIVDQNQNLIASAHNETERQESVLAHAELLAIRRASEKLGNWRLSGCTLYCTLEPCVMCMGAIQLSRIERLVCGAPDKRLGGLGSFIDLTEKKHPFHTVCCERGILSEPSAELLKKFFRDRR